MCNRPTNSVLEKQAALLLVCAVMIVLLVLTLGLAPSVIGKSQWLPEHHQ
jgi:hypothetical protein